MQLQRDARLFATIVYLVRGAEYDEDVLSIAWLGTIQGG